VKLFRGSPTKGLEFEIAVPEGIGVHRDVSGQDLVLSIGELGDPTSTQIAVGAVRDGEPVTRDEHVRRVRANLERDLEPHLVDEAPVPLAGYESWWTIDAIVLGGRSLVLESWMLVRDGVGWTVTARMAWAGMHRLREPALDLVSTFHFK
jgi:hypothetical protein